MQEPLSRRIIAEALGTAFLLATVIGSGIMADRLAGGNQALALLCNTLPTGAILFVLITIFGPLSGAHFNPAVSLVFFLRKTMNRSDFTAYVPAQVLGGILGARLHRQLASLRPTNTFIRQADGRIARTVKVFEVALQTARPTAAQTRRARASRLQSGGV